MPSRIAEAEWKENLVPGTRIDLDTTAEIPGIDDGTFQRHAHDAKQNCPVSKALAGTEIRLTAKLS
jgi:osmotically inducible protein OsmC